jgi:hypothetical protein
LNFGTVFACIEGRGLTTGHFGSSNGIPFASRIGRSFAEQKMTTLDKPSPSEECSVNFEIRPVYQVHFIEPKIHDDSVATCFRIKANKLTLTEGARKKGRLIKEAPHR